MVSKASIGAMLAMLLCAAMAHAGSKDVAQGRKYYLRYCASCHGTNGDGQGPVAKSLKEQPADLRTLSEKYGTPLSIDRLARFIDGREDVAAHGPRDMPVWGERFYDIWSAKQSHRGSMKERIRKIILYLRSIQKKPGSESPVATDGSPPAMPSSR
jgi:mono/diheme cytochrome c family protein